MIQLADVDDFDLVFTDVAMLGERDGIHLAVRARRLYPEIAVIVVSSYAPDLAECLDALDPPTVFFLTYRSRKF
jgi:CheY-like chemotaxis protein